MWQNAGNKLTLDKHFIYFSIWPQTVAHTHTQILPTFIFKSHQGWVGRGGGGYFGGGQLAWSGVWSCHLKANHINSTITYFIDKFPYVFFQLWLIQKEQKALTHLSKQSGPATAAILFQFSAFACQLIIRHTHTHIHTHKAYAEHQYWIER